MHLFLFGEKKKVHEKEKHRKIIGIAAEACSLPKVLLVKPFLSRKGLEASNHSLPAGVSTATPVGKGETSSLSRWTGTAGSRALRKGSSVAITSKLWPGHR